MVLVLLLEEGLEMVGVAVLLFAMLDYLAPRVQLSAVPPGSTEAEG